MIHNRIHLLTGLALVALSAGPTGSALGQATSLSQFLAPCLDEQTFAVARIDLSRMDADAFFETAAQAASRYLDAGQLADLKSPSGRARQAMKKRIDAFKAAGGETLYVLWSTTDLPAFLVAIPTTAKTDASVLKDWVNSLARDRGLSELSQVRKQNFLLFGPPHVVERWAKTAPVALPALDQAVGAVPQAAFQVFLVPNRDAREILGAMLPSLLDGNGIQADGNAIATGLQWASLAVNLPPKPAIGLHIQASDEQSAAALGRFVASLWQRVGQIPALQQMVPNLQASLAMLTPTAQGSVSRLSLDAGQCMRLAADLVAPATIRLKATASRIRCATNLSGLGKAILIYANDYEDKLPPNLEILIKTVEMTPRGLRCEGKHDDPSAGVPFTYRGVDLVEVAASPDMIMVYCKQDHEGGRNVLFLDTHVEWLNDDQFRKVIERDNRLRRERGLVEKPAP
ncbi:MAG: hypothetical protein KBE65_03490 [Phycisphaerae bacterium]|nr:hypothetical protein [Phycisphaerae bacterium]